MIKLELRKHGVTKYNVHWGYGTLTSDDTFITYTGIVEFKDNYNLTDGSIYEVSSLDLGLNKKNVLKLVVALK